MSKRYFAAIVVAIAALAASISMNAQEISTSTSTKRILADRSAQEVMESRKDVNDASIMDIKDRYADEARVFDGNVTTVGGGSIKAVVQDKADQGISLGLVVGGESFAGKLSPLAGVTGAYQFRRIRLGLEGYASIGYPDKLSDDQSKFLELNAVGSLAVEVGRSKNLKHSFLLGGYGCFKYGKNTKYVDLGNGGYVWEKPNTFNVGGGGSFTYIYSPKWSPVYHVFEVRAGVNHKLHTEGSVEQTAFEFGGKKAYFQASLTYKLMFGVGKRHSKSYNVGLQNQGYSKSQIRSMVGLK